MKTYFAHIAEDGRTQNVEQHLQGTAAICAAFAKEFGAVEQGKYIGLTHDIGKYSDEFQQTVPIADRYALTIRQAAEYFCIGENKLRALTKLDRQARFSFTVGNRTLIKRVAFERYLDECASV